METTGQRLTKARICACGNTQESLLNTRCNTCQRDVNQLRKLADQIAGTRTIRFSLSREEQLVIWESAKMLHQAGLSVSGAEKFEAVNPKGFVYVITNPAWPYAVKVGRACNPFSRLNNYQTGDPHRAYRLAYSVFFEDCHAAETELHARLKAHQLAGEWFSITADEGAEAIEAYARSLK